MRFLNAQNVFNQVNDNQEKQSINHLQLKECLEKLGIHFEHINVFHKLLSEMDTNFTDRIVFGDFLKVYQS